MPPFNVLWVHGVGGVGKTTLLGALADVAEDAGLALVQMDLRGTEPSPVAFEAELGRALRVPEGAPVLDALAAGRPVLLLDTFEEASALEDWICERLAPALPAGGVLVIAGRHGTARARAASRSRLARAAAGGVP